MVPHFATRIARPTLEGTEPRRWMATYSTSKFLGLPIYSTVIRAMVKEALRRLPADAELPYLITRQAVHFFINRLYCKGSISRYPATDGEVRFVLTNSDSWCWKPHPMCRQIRHSLTL